MCTVGTCVKSVQVLRKRTRGSKDDIQRPDGRVYLRNIVMTMLLVLPSNYRNEPCFFSIYLVYSLSPTLVPRSVNFHQILHNIDHFVIISLEKSTSGPLLSVSTVCKSSQRRVPVSKPWLTDVTYSRMQRSNRR